MSEYQKHGGFLYTDCDQVESQQEFYIRCRENGLSPSKQEELDRKFHIQQRLTTLTNAINLITSSEVRSGVTGQTAGMELYCAKYSGFTKSVISDNLQELYKLTGTSYQE